MDERVRAITWFIVGAAVGFGGLALGSASLGVLALVPAVLVGGVLFVLRIRHVPALLVGAGTGIAVPWALHISSGDTPDDQLWPVLAGLLLVAAGASMSFRRRPAPEDSPADPVSLGTDPSRAGAKPSR